MLGIYSVFFAHKTHLDFGGGEQDNTHKAVRGVIYEGSVFSRWGSTFRERRQEVRWQLVGGGGQRH